eukprot:12274617-Heterocapsa_arctica.AAC.1
MARVASPRPSMVPSGFFQQAMRAACAAAECQAPASRLRILALVRMCNADPRYPPIRTTESAPKGELH